MINNLFMRDSLLMTAGSSTAPLPPDSFVTTWTMTGMENFKLKTQPYNYDCMIDWGDGTSPTHHTTGDPIHLYTKNGNYQIKISGQYSGIRIYNDSQGLKLKSINQWGNVGFVDLSYAFWGCSNLLSIPNTPIPITGLNNVTQISKIFANCTQLTYVPENIFSNCVNVLSANDCFIGDRLLNCNIEHIFNNCPNITNVSNVFYNCTALTSNMEHLFDNCPNITNFYTAFYNCYNITGNAPLLWNRTNVVYSTQCFYNCTKLSNYASIPSGWK